VVARGVLQERAERLAQTAFLGGLPSDFERMGRAGFELLFAEGLQPNSKLLDVGCGALRVGYWVMRFLDPDSYFGIEVRQDMLRVGLEEVVEPGVVERANARFSHNDEFDFSVFGERFDFVFARSIWSHASKTQISAMLASFAATTAPGAVFLASYFPASPWARLGRRYPRAQRMVANNVPLELVSPMLAKLPSLGLSREYTGEQWAGRSHESDQSGRAEHSLRWIARETAQHGLSVQLTAHRVIKGQFWLRVTHARHT
jgi:SAM-dependent methyltransferase